VEIAVLQEFYKDYSFLTAPAVAHIQYSMAQISRSFHTFDLKYHRKSQEKMKIDLLLE
jgi:hypothetical protein